MAWASSNRRERLPSDWRRRRTQVLKRDPLCRLALPHICTRLSTEVDHITRGDNHTLTNLQGVCTPCHKHKTATEHPTRLRNPEPHPGAMITAPARPGEST